MECITDAKEKKTKRSIVVATEDVINVETDVIERIQMIEQICMLLKEAYLRILILLTLLCGGDGLYFSFEI